MMERCPCFISKEIYVIISVLLQIPLGFGLGLLAFFGEYGTDYSASMAGICLTTIPVIIAYILFQEKIENGLMSGAVKG